MTAQRIIHLKLCQDYTAGMLHITAKDIRFLQYSKKYYWIIDVIRNNLFDYQL